MTDASPFCRCLYYAANALARNITRLADEAFAPVGLSPSHAFVLMTVNQQPGIQPSEVARVMMLQPSTVTRLVDKLEAKGYLERRTEGKASYLHPTARAAELEVPLQQAWERVHAAYEGPLGTAGSDDLTASIYAAALRLEGVSPQPSALPSTL